MALTYFVILTIISICHGKQIPADQKGMSPLVRSVSAVLARRTESSANNIPSQYTDAEKEQMLEVHNRRRRQSGSSNMKEIVGL